MSNITPSFGNFISKIFFCFFVFVSAFSSITIFTSKYFKVISCSDLFLNVNNPSKYSLWKIRPKFGDKENIFWLEKGLWRFIPKFDNLFSKIHSESSIELILWYIPLKGGFADNIGGIKRKNFISTSFFGLNSWVLIFFNSDLFYY